MDLEYIARLYKLSCLGLETASTVKSTCYSWRKYWFNTQHPHSGSQPSVAPLPGDDVLFLPL